MARVRSAAASWLCALAVSCGAAGYAPFPLDLGEPLPPDAFARCRAVLLRRFEALTESDEAGFLLQTAWTPSNDPPGERRASVFLDPDFEHSLSVVVELRRLSLPLFGLPEWTEPRGDAAAERALAAELLEALVAGEAAAVTR